MKPPPRAVIPTPRSLRSHIPNPTGKRRPSGDAIGKKFVRLLYEEFLKSGKSLTEFSRDVGMSAPHVSQLFSGGRKAGCTITTVVSVWKILGRSLDKDFLTGD